MKHRLQGRSVADLERDFRDAQAKMAECGLDGPELERLLAYQRFIEREGHRVAQQPSVLWALAHAEAKDARPYQDAVAREGDGYRLGRPWFRLLNPPEQCPDPERLRTLKGHTGWVHAVALAADGRHALSGK